MLDSVQIFPFPHSGESAQWGNYTSPPHCAASLKPFPGHSWENNFVLITNFTFHSICSSLLSFHPSFNQHPCCLCWVLGTQTGIGPIPCPQRAPSWDILAALPFPALQAQTQARPPGKPPAQGPRARAENPRGRDIHGNPERKRQSDSQGAERESSRGEGKATWEQMDKALNE